MTGSRPEKSMTVAAYSSPRSVTTAVELWRGSYGQRATPFTVSSTALRLPICSERSGKSSEKNYEQKYEGRKLKKEMRRSKVRTKIEERKEMEERI